MYRLFDFRLLATTNFFVIIASLSKKIKYISCKLPPQLQSVKVHLSGNSLHIPYRECTLYRLPFFLNDLSHLHP